VRVIANDHRGTGRSAAWPAPVSMATLPADAARVLNDRRLPAAHLVGLLDGRQCRTRAGSPYARPGEDDRHAVPLERPNETAALLLDWVHGHRIREPTDPDGCADTYLLQWGQTMPLARLNDLRMAVGCSPVVDVARS
jgi:hypothetical protein